MLMTAVMIVLYAMFPSMPMLAAAVIVCGLLDSFGLTVVVNAFIKTKEKAQYSDHNALIVYILVSRIGQTAGSSVIAATNNLMILGVMLLVGMGGFIILNGGRRK